LVGVKICLGKEIFSISIRSNKKELEGKSENWLTHIPIRLASGVAKTNSYREDSQLSAAAGTAGINIIVLNHFEPQQNINRVGDYLGCLGWNFGIMLETSSPNAR
jgi:hypothetical protein